MIIGIFGQSGSGKTVASDYFQKLGWFVINGDLVSREILEKGTVGLRKVIEVFGEQFLNQDGSLNRSKLGAKVFSDQGELEKLNAITKPIIENAIMNMVKNHNGKNIIIDGAILTETNIVNICDKTILIKSKLNIERLIKRDNLTEIEVQNRLKSQILNENADIIIENNSDIETFYEKINDAICKLGV
jgi:dephospho-CoA kinase